MKVALIVACLAVIMAAQEVQPIRFEQLLELSNDTSRVFVRNFWATWCKPCVEEMPVFDSLVRRNPTVKVELISLDAPADSVRVRTFWRRRGFGGVQVYHLIERLRSEQINALSPLWSGAVPMTIVSRGMRRIVHEGELSLSELEQLIEQIRQSEH
jgi:thiol-disulfide isomerase/thioredoxin